MSRLSDRPSTKRAPAVTEWQFQQMVKASGWPLPVQTLEPGADFHAILDGGMVPLHWVCEHGKDGLLKYMVEHGAMLTSTPGGGLDLLELALDSGSFQTVMYLIDQLKPARVLPPSAALKERLTQAFQNGHVNSRNRLQQTLRDWERIAKNSP